MKTLLHKLLSIALLVLVSAHVAQSTTCNASFTKTISGLTVTFTNTSTTSSGFPNMMIYYWNFGDGTFSTLKNPVKTYSSGGVKIIQLMINDSFGCSKTITDTIMVGSSAPSCSASFTKTISGLSVTFNNTSYTSGSSTAAVHYHWSFSDGTTSDLKNPVKTFAAAGIKVAQLNLYDSSTSCSANYADTFAVGSASSCAANFSRSISGLTVTFTNTSLNTNGTSTGLSYYWYFSDGTSSTLKNPTKTFTSAGSKTAQLTISDSLQGCFSSKTETFTVTSSVATCSASFTKTISGLTVTFNNTSSSSGSSTAAVFYHWSFSDGTTSDLKNPVKTFATAGTKVAQLNLYDSSTYCSAYVTDTFVVAAASTCAASFTKTISGLAVTFNNTSSSSGSSTAAVHYHWSFSDGTTSDLKNPVKTFATAGTKVAQLSLYDSSTSCTAFYTDTFVVSAASSCAANFSRSISGLTVTFTNTSLNTNGTSAGLSYYWYFSDGTSSTLKNPTKTFTTAGVKTAQLTISDSSQGCFSSKTETFTLASSSSCAASFTFPLIAPLTLRFTSTSTNSNGSTAGLTYHWEFSDGTSSTLATLVKSFATSGVKWARLTISDSLLGCYATRIDSFLVPSSSCAANFTRTVSGLTVTFTNTSLNTNGTAAGLTYLWTFGDGTFSSLANPVKTFASAGTKTVKLTISDSSQACYSNKTETIILSSSCHASFSRTVSGLTVTFNNTSTNTNGSSAGLSYLWNFGDGTTSTLKNPVKTFTTAGAKIIQLTISDSSQGCSATATETVTLLPLCNASFTLAIDTTMPFHFFLLNTSVIRSTSTFFWSFGDGGTSTSMTPTHTYASFGVYYVCLTVADSVCTSTYCDSIGMDSTGRLLKDGAFGFQTIDMTTVSPTTGIGETAAVTQYSVYPNPTASDVHIDYTVTSAVPMTFQVTDITGKVVFTETISAAPGQHTQTIDTHEFKPSIYFLNITSPEGQQNYKLIKN